MSIDKLREIYYNPDEGYVGFNKFYNKVIKRLSKNEQEKISKQDIKEFYDTQEINQLNRKVQVKKSKFFRIVAPNLSFQMDMFYVPWALKSESEADKKKYHIFMLFVDILSRKAWVYTIPDRTTDSKLTIYSLFKSDLKNDIEKLGPNEYQQTLPANISTDNEFKDIQKSIEADGVRTNMQISKEDHITGGDRLGIIDRLVRTLKNMLMRYVFTHRHYSIPEVMKKLIQNYNNTSHVSLDGLTPNEIFSNRKKRKILWNEARQHNDIIKKSNTFSIGDRVRIYKEGNDFMKEKPRFSNEIYTIVGMKGYKFNVSNGEHELQRKLKTNEMIKVDEIDKPVDKENIKRLKKQEKEEKIKKKLKRSGVDPSYIREDQRRSYKTDFFRPS